MFISVFGTMYILFPIQCMAHKRPSKILDKENLKSEFEIDRMHVEIKDEGSDRTVDSDEIIHEKLIVCSRMG